MQEAIILDLIKKKNKSVALERAAEKNVWFLLVFCFVSNEKITFGCKFRGYLNKGSLSKWIDTFHIQPSCILVQNWSLITTLIPQTCIMI